MAIQRLLSTILDIVGLEQPRKAVENMPRPQNWSIAGSTAYGATFYSAPPPPPPQTPTADLHSNSTHSPQNFFKKAEDCPKNSCKKTGGIVGQDTGNGVCGSTEGEHMREMNKGHQGEDCKCHPESVYDSKDEEVKIKSANPPKSDEQVSSQKDDLPNRNDEGNPGTKATPAIEPVDNSSLNAPVERSKNSTVQLQTNFEAKVSLTAKEGHHECTGHEPVPTTVDSEDRIRCQMARFYSS